MKPLVQKVRRWPMIPEHWGLVGMVTAITAIVEQFRDQGPGSGNCSWKPPATCMKFCSTRAAARQKASHTC
jgi:hypothetical protein